MLSADVDNLKPDEPMLPSAHHQAMNRGRNKRIFITELGAETLLAVI